MAASGEAREPGTRAVLRLSAGVAAIAAALTAASAGGAPPTAASPLSWFVIACLFFLGEVFLVHFEHRRESHAVGFATVPLVVGLATVPPLALAGARLAGGGLALAAYRRQPPVKLALNLSSFWLEAAVAVAVFRALAGGEITSPGSWPAVLAAALAADVVQALVVTAAISLYQRRLEVLVGSAVLLGGAVTVANTSLAVLTVTLLAAQPAALVPLCALVPVLFASYRAHTRLREKHQALEQLQELTRRAGEAVLDGTVVPTLLAQVEDLMHAERAWLCGPEPEGSLAARLHALAHAAGRPVVVSDPLAPGAADPALREALERAGITDALVAPLPRVSDAVATTLAVANRSGEVRPFGPGDLRLFGTIVNVAGAALENSHLLDRLREQAAEAEHQSLHDALTGLPNRTLFGRRLGEALASGHRLAVLLLDLDRFKEVNDTLGHHSGDVLLQEVGHRVALPLRDGDTIARLGGDEFGVLLRDVQGSGTALQVARSVLAALEEPFDVAGVTVDVGASVGVVVAPDHGSDAAVLLQRADVAMYTAKADGSGVELYRPERDAHTADRLALAAELRRAIDRRAVSVHYQPQVDLRSGDVLGVEALVRWIDRPAGAISPAEVVALAEKTGLIRPLTLLVLEEAVRQCSAWWRSGHRLRMSVNLSARVLLQPGLVEDVAGVLRAADLPPSALCLELTETSLMAEDHRTADMLDRLHRVGATIAIDDFGMGYSSLDYLRRLPVGEIKVDRSFVIGMAHDATDEAIVRSVVDLARNLGLPVVAEGVETEEAAETLRSLGCDQAQGYLYARPLPAPELTAWLAGAVVASRPTARASLRAVG